MMDKVLWFAEVETHDRECFYTALVDDRSQAMYQGCQYGLYLINIGHDVIRVRLVRDWWKKYYGRI